MRPVERKTADRRLGILQLAEALGSVAEACRRSGISRTQFYELRHRYLTQGLEGLKALPPVHRSHPQTTPPKVAEKILTVSREHPLWGCGRICSQLGQMGIAVSSPTIQKVLIAANLGTREERLHRLEESALDGNSELSEELVRAIEQANPCFKERFRESSRPGELLTQDTSLVGNLDGIGKIYLQSVVDTYNSYAFAYLHAGKLSRHAALVVQQNVLPRYEEWGLIVSEVLTDNCREYCGRESHPYEFCLLLNDIEHRTTTTVSHRANGFVERFIRTVHDEFLRPSLQNGEYRSIDALQEDLDAWLAFYNEESPHRGYRNRGAPPAQILKEYLDAMADAGKEPL